MINTRREFLLSGAASLGAALASYSEPVKSLLGSRDRFDKENPFPTAKDYVQDGLVAMWDGIENAGWGEHDPNATTWKNLVATDTIELNSVDCSIGNNSVTTLAGHQLRGTVSALTGWSYSADNSVTIEVVFSLPSIATYSTFIALGFREFRTYADSNRSSMRTEYGIPNGSGTGVYASFTQTKINATSVNSISFTSAIDSTNASDFQRMNIVRINASAISIGRRNPFSSSRDIDDLVIGFDQTGAVEVSSIRIYSRALAAAEIAHNYSIDKVRFNLA